MDQSSGDFVQLENSLEWPSELAPGPGHPVQLEQTNYTVDWEDDDSLMDAVKAFYEAKPDLTRFLDKGKIDLEKFQDGMEFNQWMNKTCFDQEVRSVGKSGGALRGRREI